MNGNRSNPRNSKKNFKNNFERWEKLYPQRASQLLQNETQQLIFCKTKRGELNLKRKNQKTDAYFHSVQGAALEADEWFASLDLNGVAILYVSGLGLGYYYEAAKKWLSQNKAHTLIFIEHDFEVIRRFFETEIATKMLYDKQVRLRYAHLSDPNDEIWTSISHYYGSMPYKISSLQSYLHFYPDIANVIETRIAFACELCKAFGVEFSSYGERFFFNFYQNILSLPDAYQTSQLYGQFKNIPAIICGAGPSLDKNLALLETLGDRALIFAGGTAMNGVNSHGFLPHFGLGIDPNPTQMIRLVSNKAFTTPYLYRNRMFPQALRLIQGDILYTTGSGGYDISEYFEKSLNITGPKIEEGLNVINFNLSLAYMLGCSPIIFVGVDLAYTDQRSYPSGILAHASHNRRLDFRTKGIHEELLETKDIYGNPICTLWKWVMESTWFSNFANAHPEVVLINATEGGIGFKAIPNLPLEAVAKLYLTKTFDFNTLIHGNIQNSSMPPDVNLDKINSLLEDLKRSLSKCCEYTQKIDEELSAISKKLQEEQEEKELPENFFPETCENHVKRLEQEIAYTYILKNYNQDFPLLVKIDMEQIFFDEKRATRYEMNSRKVAVIANQYKFLKNAALCNKRTLEFALEQQKQLFAASPRQTVSMLNSAEQQKNRSSEKSQYLFENGVFTLNDQELALAFSESFSIPSQTLSLENFDYSQNPDPSCLNGKYQVHYPSGALKREHFYLEGALHGPSTFFSENGKILAQSWYIRGTRQGKSWFYYLSGQLHSVRSYRNGMLEGKQEYFYPNQQLKTQVSYDKGVLEGDVYLYYSNGELKRELHFVKGRRNGMDRMWNEASTLILEGEYCEDAPVGTSRIWHSNGQLLQQIVYKDSLPISSLKWNERGVLQAKDIHDDFFDKATKESQALTDSLENVAYHLNALAPLLSANTPEEIRQDLEELKLAIAHLNGLNQKVLENSGLSQESDFEPIWKTPLSRQLLQKQLEENSKVMTQIVTAMQTLVSQLIKTLAT